ncbi:MAG: methyltransferase [Nitrospinae bacterium CG22_combo_CG10-13_8_21_14_all_47_10]|nr:MAG: methyltransferase [Nitrospinae bacterium CG22_combo_CG10-13_8_21_14_all_47_10]
MIKRHRIQFPKDELNAYDQSETYFYLHASGHPRKIRFHDYDEIYQIPGLYEQLFYDRLKCVSPVKVTAILESAIKQSQENFSELRVLDLGAGNGMVGEELKKRGVSRLIGVDIIVEAFEAAQRDRPGVYDAYYVEDFCLLSEESKESIASWQCDCMITVAALGFGDIPVKAFIEAFNIIKTKGWIGFNIKDTFLDQSDNSGFSKMVRELIFSKYLDIYHIERYRHRLSTEGEPLHYFAIAGKKNADVPLEFLKSKNFMV